MNQEGYPKTMKFNVFSIASLLLAAGANCQAFCQEAASKEAKPAPKIGKLSDDEFAALDRATAESVAATVSFLASDELGGRRSTTKEFDIAAAYVASRLQAAGAEGLGPAGSYYVTSEVEMQFAPSDGASFAIGGEGKSETRRISVLSGGAAPVKYDGAVQVVRSANDKITKPGPVLFALPSEQAAAVAKSSRLLAQISSTMRREGATAILLVADAASPLWNVAKSRQDEGMLQRGGQTDLPVAVVDCAIEGAEAQIDLSIPATTVKTAQMRNVAAVIRGSDAQLKHEAVLFSAHLDHLGTAAGDDSEDRIYNGADDDATGVTAVLTLADMFGALERKPLRSVVFVTFWGEEMGLLGSKKYVESPAWPLEKTVANVNIEMIGRPEEGATNKAWMTGWKHSDLGELFRLGARRVAMEVFDHPQFGEMLYKRSDNWAFAQAGVVAHSFSAGSLHSDYHQVTDEWHKLNIPHMTQVIRGLFAGALPIANGEVTPAAVE